MMDCPYKHDMPHDAISEVCWLEYMYGLNIKTGDVTYTAARSTWMSKNLYT